MCAKQHAHARRLSSCAVARAFAAQSTAQLCTAESSNEGGKTRGVGGAVSASGEQRCSATTAPTIAGWQALPTFGTGIHIMKFKCNFEGMVRRQESAGVCVACRFQEGKWGVEAAFQGTCNAWHVCCCNCANVCGGCCIWRTSLAFPCVLALLQLCPACCCTATAYAAPQLECRGVGTAAAAHAACGSRDVQHEVTSSAHNLQLPVRRPTNARAAAFQVGGGCRQFRKG